VPDDQGCGRHDLTAELYSSADVDIHIGGEPRLRPRAGRRTVLAGFVRSARYEPDIARAPCIKGAETVATDAVADEDARRPERSIPNGSAGDVRSSPGSS
jgi:hypothetical protein